eukprot:GFUD01014907.1.p1 GENE.GFUD01014907.1~~GFUD01014907.1.p1  ORF type:complete len:149 (-),score=45.83 GFUD01014907.1:926-1372(-)
MELEVAAALLDASRRLSSGEVARDGELNTAREKSDDNPQVRTISIMPLTSAVVAMLKGGEIQLPDTPGNLPLHNDWLGGWGRTSQARSETEGSSFILSWLGGKIHDKDSLAEDTERLKVRRSSSKDVEEAMAGGLSKERIWPVGILIL